MSHCILAPFLNASGGLGLFSYPPACVSDYFLLLSTPPSLRFPSLPGEAMAPRMSRFLPRGPPQYHLTLLGPWSLLRCCRQLTLEIACVPIDFVKVKPLLLPYEVCTAVPSDSLARGLASSPKPLNRAIAPAWVELSATVFILDPISVPPTSPTLLDSLTYSFALHTSRASWVPLPSAIGVLPDFPLVLMGASGCGSDSVVL